MAVLIGAVFGFLALYYELIPKNILD